MPLKKRELQPCKYGCHRRVNPKGDPVQTEGGCGMCCDEAKAEREKIMAPLVAENLKKAEAKQKAILGILASRQKSDGGKASARK